MKLINSGQHLLPVLASLLLVFTSFAGVAAESVGMPEVTAEAVAVLDDSGRLLYGKNEHKRFAMASLTKTMTAVIALEQTDIKRRVLIDVSWDEIPDSSVMGLSLMESLTIEDLLYGLMLPSGNDAASALARTIAGDEYRFARLMNEKARQLGMRDTHFMNPHGMDEEGHYSSAYDQALLGRYAMQNPTLAEIVQTREITIRGRGVYPLVNINRFLNSCDGANGVKSGYTEEAMAAVVGSVTRGGTSVFIAALRSQDYPGDATVVVDYYFAHPELFPAMTPAPASTATAGH